ncbi:hypothetical protein [Bradyrhizobium sp. SYSU BS000235]|uniref:hypothetical protein n=1 Tax=Bradyrhizobium sp. SYSU BS000235 TaxID=3411332 RepID=UPI003C734182
MRKMSEELVNTERKAGALKAIFAVDLLTLSITAITCLCLIYYLAVGDLKPMDFFF